MTTHLDRKRPSSRMATLRTPERVLPAPPQKPLPPPSPPLHPIANREPLPMGSTGDVVAAGLVARALLAGRGWPTKRDRVLPRLILTAISLQAPYSGGEAACVEDLAHLAAALLRRPTLRKELQASPVQLVRYAGAELEALSAGECEQLLGWLVALLRSFGRRASE